MVDTQRLDHLIGLTLLKYCTVQCTLKSTVQLKVNSRVTAYNVFAVVVYYFYSKKLILCST